MSIDVNGSIHRGRGVGGGRFTGHVAVAPAGGLEDRDGFDPDGAGCDRCGVGDRVPGERYCAGCLAEEQTGGAVAASACARCDSPATGPDGLCDRHTGRWGSVGVREGSGTPWGPADDVSRVAPGIVQVSTPSHGGVKLSPERNRVIPSALRNRSGWYEEDCEAHIPVRYFPDAFAAQPHMVAAGRAADDLREEADQSIRDWFPDKWEHANGRKLAPGESRERDEQDWAARHADDQVVVSASTAETDPRMVVVTATPGGDQTRAAVRADYLVPADEYHAGQAREDAGPDDLGRHHRFVVDPRRHPRLPDRPPAPPEPREEAFIPDVDRVRALASGRTLTAAARERVTKDLDKMWRNEDGTVQTLDQILRGRGVSGKTAYVEGTRTTYALQQPTPDGHSYYSLQVSKATFDAFTDVPDRRSPADVAAQAARRFTDRVYAGGRRRPTAEQAAKAHALQAEADRLRQEERAAREAREGTWQERAARLKAERAARERAARITG